MECNFDPASPDEEIVYGACRPGRYDDESDLGGVVSEWITYMQDHGIERVCCLLDRKLDRYDNLTGQYEQAFGENNVCHAPITDYSVVDKATWRERIYPFLSTADTRDEPVIVHCSAGQGRTGHILALWLAHGRGYDVETGVETVRETGRSPLEGGKSIQDLQGFG